MRSGFQAVVGREPRRYCGCKQSENEMYKSILIPTDGSELAVKAIEHGLALAKTVNAAVIFVTATADWSATQMAELVERGVAEPVQHYEKKAAAWAGKVLAECEERAKRVGVNCTTVHVHDKAAADAIIETAKAKGCDLIVMSSHGRGGVGHILLGSVANKVLTYSTLPVLISR
jgi:nucleotide-binding universal stress UspA family protein